MTEPAKRGIAVVRPAAGVNTGQINFYDGTQYVIQSGDQHIHHVTPAYRIKPFSFESAPKIKRTERMLPSRLLAVSERVVPFTGREVELAALTAWRDNLTSALTVLLVYGSGGQGKTRLAYEFGSRSAREGWQVLQASHQSDPSALGAAGSGINTGARGVLLVVDYAEQWPLEHLLSLVTDPLLQAKAVVRVLLLARSTEWRQALAHRLNIRNISIDTQGLSLLADTTDKRTNAFNAARDTFAELLGLPDPRVITEPSNLADPVYGVALNLHMAALRAVDAALRGYRASDENDPTQLSRYLIDREKGYWNKWYVNRLESPHADPKTMSRVVYIATLTHPLAYDDAVDALKRVGLATTSETAQRLLGAHAILYPPTDPATVLEPLRPDRLGEDFLAMQTPGNDIGNTADPWTISAVAQLLDVDDSGQGPPTYSAQVVMSLIQTARRWPHVAHHNLYPLLRRRPTLALAGGSAALASLADIPDADIEMLGAIEQQFPAHGDSGLDAGIAAITVRLAHHRLEVVTDPAQRAELLTRLGWRMSNAGLHELAMDATTQAVATWRQLVSANPLVYEPNLALSLTNLGNHLSGLGRRGEALAVTEEAVEVYRRLAAVNPAAYEPDLASALTNIGIQLSGVGQSQEALAVTEEAVDIRRRLAAVNPDAYEPDLAATVNNLGIVLSTLGRRDAALAVTEEAVEVYRRLAAVNPASYEPYLASALTNLGTRWSGLGRLHEALAVTEEAVDIRRRLVEANPAAYEPDLASALTNLGIVLSTLGRRNAALAVTEEAVGVYRRLAAVNPAAYEPDLASALTNLGVQLSVERLHEALAVTEEAVDIRRRLATVNPAAYEPDLASELWSFAWVRVSGEIDLASAASAAKESITIYQGIAAQLPATFTDDLWGSVHTLAHALDELGRSEDAAKLRRTTDHAP
jgi:tetratricopeptide (TPR) repeat protein